MMSTITLILLIMSPIVCFLSSWLRLRRRYCRGVVDRWEEGPQVHLASIGAILCSSFLFFDYSVYAYIALYRVLPNSWGAMRTFITPTVVILSLVAVGFGLFFALVIIENLAYTAGQKWKRYNMHKIQAACLNNIKNVQGCPRACHNCPLEKRHLLEVREIIMADEVEQVIPGRQSIVNFYPVYAIKNNVDGKFALAERRIDKNYRPYFSPIESNFVDFDEIYEHNKDVFEIRLRQNDVEFIDLDKEFPDITPDYDLEDEAPNLVETDLSSAFDIETSDIHEISMDVD